MKKIKRNTLLFGLLLSLTVLKAQNPVSDMKALGRLYNNANSTSMNVEVSFMDPQSSAKITLKGWMKKSGSNFTSYIGGKTVLSNPKCMLMLLEDQKVIVYNNPVKPEDMQNGLEMTDSVFYSKKKMNYLPAPDGKKKIEVIFPEDGNLPIRKMEVTYTPGKMIEQIDYYYNPVDPENNSNNSNPSVVTIRYSQVEFNKSISNATFSESPYIVRSWGAIKPTGRYKGFKVIDQTLNKIQK